MSEQALRELIAKLETYDFQCEAGSLLLCTDWQALKKAALATSAKCGEHAGHFIAGVSRFACVLPKGHNGEHKQGGTCFFHGEYVGEQCPEWPKCIEKLAASAPEQLSGPITEEMFSAAMAAGDIGYCEGECNIQKMVEYLNARLEEESGK